MATFECNSCGKCCVGLGPYITIERNIGDRDFYCRNKITGELFLAHIQPEYALEFEEDIEGKEGSAGSESGCVFMMKSHAGVGSVCAIYPTRPAVCREFRCYRMFVYSAAGELRGTVFGKNGIRTQDESLAKIWKDRIVSLPCSNQGPSTDPAWSKKVLGILEESGYRGDPFE